MRRIATAQANALNKALSERVQQIPNSISALIPSIIVEYVARLPVAGLSYWADRRWHIHVRKEDPVDTQVFTVLHQLKQIVDHLFRRQPNRFTNKDWDDLANYFAYQMLAHAGITPPSKKAR